ncbi:14454_t:CDS:2 [Ambispora leptoticha]|uniref:14454_t:CDS:1 n=1 Tax=Ambispora leptoticha TaxID=144679 RepID=A0A9N8ZSH7_9GLOM|nr:14454_t:CDS:2 [Ambispora leptoticha]
MTNGSNAMADTAHGNEELAYIPPPTTPPPPISGIFLIIFFIIPTHRTCMNYEVLVTAIWEIDCGEDMNDRYNAYRDAVERKRHLDGKPFSKGDGRRKMTADNEQRRFHGTKLGKGFPQTMDDPTLKKPPNGDNSILGEPSPFGNLNYDEVVVYNEAAC